MPAERKKRAFVSREKERREGDPRNLMNFEEKVYSQNGEDGVIAEVLDRIGIEGGFFVEIGIETGRECNTRLLHERGWSGKWIEGHSERAQAAKDRFADDRLEVVSAFVTTANINELVPDSPDLFSLDIDGNDYWILSELKARPKVLVLEYNSSVPPGKDWVMPYREDHRWRGDNYYGASLSAYTALCRELGYTLVGCESAGANAFYVRDDILAPHREKFTQLDGGSEYHYACPKVSRYFFGHAPRWMAGPRRLVRKLRGPRRPARG